MPNATLRDVARLADVSIATASRAINGNDGVSPETRIMVLDAAAKLGFLPNAIARSLKLARTQTLGLVTDDIEGVFTMLMARGVEDVATAEGFGVFLCNSYGDPERERDHLAMLLAKQVDGIILLSGYRVRERGAPPAVMPSIPVVYLYQYTDDPHAAAILPDDEMGGHLAVSHLIESGARKVAMLNGPSHFEATHKRLAGAKRAMADHGRSPDQLAVYWGDKWHEGIGYALAAQLTAEESLPDGVFCASDSLAAGFITALAEHRVRVPGDVAVVGFDNRYQSVHMRPALTTVAPPFHEMGQRAASLVIGALRGEPTPPGIQELPCTLVVRESTRPARDASPGVPPPRDEKEGSAGAL